VNEKWRPPEWKNPHIEKAQQLSEWSKEKPRDAQAIQAWVKTEAQAGSFEAGASAIIEPVRKETLREVGKWLRRRRPKLCDPDYYFHLSVGKDELEVFERGEMPEEEK
jgi:hypothetical protein